MSCGEHPAWRIRLNHLLAKSLRATIAASRGLRHQNRLKDKRDVTYLKGIGKYKTRNTPVDKIGVLKQQTLERYTYIYIYIYTYTFTQRRGDAWRDLTCKDCKGDRSKLGTL